MFIYQNAVKEAKSAQFSDIISRNNHNPQVFFRIIQSIIDNSSASSPRLDAEFSGKCLGHFRGEVETITLY